jgi:serine/threonine protein kinase
MRAKLNYNKNMKCNNCDIRISNLIKLKCPTSNCDKFLCNSKCLNIHISTIHIALISNDLKVRSPFLRTGEFLKEYKNDKIYDFNNFKFLKLGEDLHIIGSGAFGDVYLAKNNINGKYYAIKKLNKNKITENGITRDMVLREVQIHRRLVHDNIVKLYSHYEDYNDYYLIMEYINKNTIYHTIKLNEGGLNEKKAFKYFIQVVSALNFLHNNNLIHRDIKPENLLVDDKDRIKLCDFGWCVDLKHGNRVTFCGTFEYMAPELIKELPYNYGVDIWSLGVLLYELLHGYSPFKDNYGDCNYNEIFRNILKNNLSIIDDISDHGKDLIKRIF